MRTLIDYQVINKADLLELPFLIARWLPDSKMQFSHLVFILKG